MFLVRLVHLSGIKNKDDTIKKKNLNNPISTSTNLEFRKDETIDQIKNITQEKKNQNQKYSQMLREKRKNKLLHLKIFWKFV